MFLISGSTGLFAETSTSGGGGRNPGTGRVEVLVINTEPGELPATRALSFRYLERPERSFRRGDADEDGRVTVSDAVEILRHLFAGASVTCLDALDTDDSGAVTLTDAVHLLEYLFLHGQPPPPPHPHAGEDPTEDGLGCG